VSNETEKKKPTEEDNARLNQFITEWMRDHGVCCLTVVGAHRGDQITVETKWHTPDTAIYESEDPYDKGSGFVHVTSTKGWVGHYTVACRCRWVPRDEDGDVIKFESRSLAQRAGDEHLAKYNR